MLIFVVSSTYLHWQFRVNLTKTLRLREVIGAARRFHEGEGRDAYNSLVSDQDGHGLWIRGGLCEEGRVACVWPLEQKVKSLGVGA